MAIEYKVRISEKQRKLIMRALTTTVANNRRSVSGEVLGDDDWMELISVFSALTMGDRGPTLDESVSDNRERKSPSQSATHYCTGMAGAKFAER